MSSAPRRVLALALVTLAAGSAGTFLAVSDPSPAAAEPNWPDGFGPCVGNCPPNWSHGDNTDKGYRDSNLNVFVGGDMSVVEGAAEVEGRVAVFGNFSQNKSGGGDAYNIGVVGAGSQVRPPANSVAFAVGGDITIAPGQRALLDGDAALPLEAQHAGTVTGTVIAAKVTQNDDAVSAYKGAFPKLQAIAECIDDTARTKATGTAVNTGSETVFTGDGTSSLQIFDVDFDLMSSSGGLQGIRLAGVPSGASVIVNVRGATRQIRTYTGGDGGPLDAQGIRLLWSFPEAAAVDLIGPTQFQGSLLVANPASTTHMAYSGANGRMYTAGNLIHGGGGLRGQEFHSFPYLGALPDCNSNTTTTTTTASTTTTTTGSTTTTTSASTTSTTADASSSSTTHGAMVTTTAPRPGGRTLANTGASLTTIASLGLVLAATGVVLAFSTRRSPPPRLH